MNISLSPKLQRFIAEKVRSGRYHSPDEVIREGLELLEAQEVASDIRRRTDSQSVAETFASIASGVPDSEWAKVPADLSKNLDRYLYGSRTKVE